MDRPREFNVSHVFLIPANYTCFVMGGLFFTRKGQAPSPRTSTRHGAQDGFRGPECPNSPTHRASQAHFSAGVQKRKLLVCLGFIVVTSVIPHSPVRETHLVVRRTSIVISTKSLGRCRYTSSVYLIGAAVPSKAPDNRL